MNNKIHEVQIVILRELLFHPQAGYAEMQKSANITSDHFSFHINRLVDLGLVERVEKGVYRLTIAGKEYANKLDTDNNTIERQPKSAVMLMIGKEINNETKYIIQRRVKNPNYGFYGFPTGKMRWGETVIEAAQRECLEEIGLSATFEVQGVYHEHVRMKETGELFEDKLFFICRATSIEGEVMELFEGGENHWLTLDEFQAKDKKFSSIENELKIHQTDTWLIEATTEYDNSLI